MATTALITGASSGIGLELARIFAANKINLVLVARNESRLKKLATELQSSAGVQVQVLAIDLGKPDSGEQVYNWCALKNIEIDYLVNNAGFGDFGMFAESKLDKQEEMIDVNIMALTVLCRLFIPGMIARKKGRIMNVASTAAFQPGPTMAVYYATKAYVLHFSEAINNELKEHGITVTALCPGATASGFQEAADMQESKLVKGKRLPSAEEVARYGYKAMMKGKAVAIHGLMNYLMANAVRFAPRSFAVKVTRMVQDK